uniref:Uncharacterized protein n=1 Tax=Cucumis melo TaxID=3656 RepID=A0A9I9E4R1_CUCME
MVSGISTIVTMYFAVKLRTSAISWRLSPSSVRSENELAMLDLIQDYLLWKCYKASKRTLVLLVTSSFEPDERGPRSSFDVYALLLWIITKEMHIQKQTCNARMQYFVVVMALLLVVLILAHELKLSSWTNGSIIQEQ